MYRTISHWSNWLAYIESLTMLCLMGQCLSACQFYCVCYQCNWTSGLSELQWKWWAILGGEDQTGKQSNSQTNWGNAFPVISSSAYAEMDVSWISAQAENMPLRNSHSINSEVQEVNKELRAMKYKCILAQIMVTVFNDHFGKGCKTRLLAARSAKVRSGLGNICPVQCAAHSWDSFPPSSSKMDEFPLSKRTKQTHSFCDQQRMLASVS